VTVAHDVADEDLDRAFEDLADFQVAFPVDAFWLYEQDVDGAWTPVRSFRLAGTR
jgi:hypothetical protein